MTFPVFSAGTSAYTLQRSLRFRSSASAYLNRTPASAGNRKTWTWSAWVKRGTLGAIYPGLFTGGATASDTGWTGIWFGADTISIGGYSTTWRVTTAVYRDPSSWYHIVVALDTTQATANNRVRLYVNGSEVTVFSTLNNPTQNTDLGINQAAAHAIAYQSLAAGLGYFDGYMAEINFIDGQQLTPSSFGATNAATGVWQPAKYTGTYGTNGFYLPFTDNSGATSTTIGKDFSGNSNNWTPNNISVTAGVTYDSMTDVPTLTSPTAANYCVMNPVDNGGLTITNGNLDSSRNVGSWLSDRCTFGMSSGKWYWEFTATSNVDASNSPMIGLMKATANIASYPGGDANGWGYFSFNGQKYTGGAAGVAYGSAWTNGDVIGIAFDADNGTLAFYKNNVSQGTAYTGLTSGPYFIAVGLFGTASGSLNFGQRPFSYTPPSGYVALNTFNLSTPTIAAGNKFMDATLYTGNGSSQTITNSGSMQPDLLWTKARSSTAYHYLQDSVRGVNKALFSNATDAEYSITLTTTTINSNGFSFNGSESGLNANTVTYVAWQWKANGAGSSNTAGSITSTVSASTTAGFSVVTYTGTGANATVGHGLGVAPSMVITKKRSSTSDWGVYHTSLGNTAYVLLDTTAASATSSTYWNNTTPTSTVFSIGTADPVNISTATYVAYCFAPIAGFSAFGSYTGNGSTDGPFIYTGFRPRWIMIKQTNASGSYWLIRDSSRSPNNVVNLDLYPNAADAENTSTANDTDFLSNGFKLRNTGGGSNTSGATYIYAAFAENPFKYSLAR